MKCKSYSWLVGFLAFFLMMPASAVDLANGQRKYEAYCAGCHGLSGVSLSEAPNLALNPIFAQPSEDVVELINNGRGRMPPYFGILSHQDVLDIFYYMRTFR